MNKNEGESSWGVYDQERFTSNPNFVEEIHTGIARANGQNKKSDASVE
jgi:hypothetical protein